MIATIETFVKEKLKDDHSGHDWAHTHRVRQMALAIGQTVGANVMICEIAALLHDVIDDKVSANVERDKQEVRQLLKSIQMTNHHIEDILAIIENLSFSQQWAQKRPLSLEGKVVQDADRLDALGAIGIIRTIAYGAQKGHVLYDPDILPMEHASKESYRNAKSTTINHFYEKLLLLKDGMHTEYAKEIAQKRHVFMEQFLTQFKQEWESID